MALAAPSGSSVCENIIYLNIYSVILISSVISHRAITANTPNVAREKTGAAAIRALSCLYTLLFSQEMQKRAKKDIR